MNQARQFQQRSLPVWLQGYWDDVIVAVKIHDQWSRPGPRDVRSGHPQTMVDPDEKMQQREHWASVMEAIRIGKKLQLFEGARFRIDPTPEQVDMAYLIVARMAILTPVEAKSIWAYARGRPEWKFTDNAWKAIEHGLWRMFTNEVEGVAV